MRQALSTILLLWALLPAEASADHLSRSTIETCANDCLGQVLMGERQLTDCVSLALVARQIIGPHARTRADSELTPVMRVLETVLGERLVRYQTDFLGATIEVTHHEPGRQAHVYGVRGWVRRTRGEDYDFSANGIFSSSRQCQVYTLTIGPLRINQWLSEQSAVRTQVAHTIASWQR